MSRSIFDVRAVAIAREIIDADPAFALQEVALWQTVPLSNTSDVTTRYDFLHILLRELERQGAPYRAAVVNPTFGGALPISVTTLGAFPDRNAIIVRSDVPAAFNTSIRLAQVAELVGIVTASPYPVVLAGDLNVYPEGSREIDAPAWDMFDDAGLVDSWAPFDRGPLATREPRRAGSDAPAGKPVGSSPAAYRSSIRQRPTSQATQAHFGSLLRFDLPTATIPPSHPPLSSKTL